MNYQDPFKADTDRYKKLLSKDSDKDYVEVEDISSEILDKSTVKGLPPSVFNSIRSANEKLAANSQKKQQVNEVFSKLFTDLSDRYGVKIQVDFESFSNSVMYMIDPMNEKAVELALSKAYGIFRVALYQQYLQAIALLSSQILDPAYLLSESMTYQQKLDTLKSLYEFMQMMNEIYEQVNIPDADIKFEKMSSSEQKSINLNDPMIRSFMDDLYKSQLKK